jgi:hypothetical protein
MKIRIEEHTRGDGSKIYGAQYREWVGVLFGFWKWKNIYAFGTYWHDTYDRARAVAWRFRDDKTMAARRQAERAKVMKTTYHYL